jgi:hypothetical protein
MTHCINPAPRIGWMGDRFGHTCKEYMDRDVHGRAMRVLGFPDTIITGQPCKGAK